jgi:septal ring factor EnvC (AmiA/AmiB activator)
VQLPVVDVPHSQFTFLANLFFYFTACAPGKLARSPDNGTLNDKQEELNRVIREQASLIDSLKAEKVTVEQSLTTLRTDHERITKENQILRRAVTIQEERRVNADQETKSVQARAEERIRALNQIILSLRYHLQAQQNVGNDFMHQPPPDVY